MKLTEAYHKYKREYVKQLVFTPEEENRGKFIDKWMFMIQQIFPATLVLKHAPLEAVFIYFDTATYDEIERDEKVMLVPSLHFLPFKACCWFVSYSRWPWKPNWVWSEERWAFSRASPSSVESRSSTSSSGLFGSFSLITSHFTVFFLMFSSFWLNRKLHTPQVFPVPQDKKIWDGDSCWQKIWKPLGKEGVESGSRKTIYLFSSLAHCTAPNTRI